MMRHFDGTKNLNRRRQAEERRATSDGLRVRAYRKKTLTFAVRLDEAFTVQTLEGLHTGKAGDWLAIGAQGEMYPIDHEVFVETYDPAEAEA